MWSVPRRIVWLIAAAGASTLAAWAAIRRRPGTGADGTERDGAEAPTGAAVTIAAEMESSPVVRYYGTDEPVEEPAAGDATAVVRAFEGLAEIELPRERRPSGATLAALAAAAAVLAMGLGAWAFVAGVRDDDPAPAPARAAVVAPPAIPEKLLALVVRPTTERIPLRGSVGRIVLAVGTAGEGALVLAGLAPAPGGRAYQAWVIPAGSATAISAGVFDGRRPIVPLKRRVPTGATVAVTLERVGGSPAPTRTPRLVAQT